MLTEALCPPAQLAHPVDHLTFAACRNITRNIRNQHTPCYTSCTHASETHPNDVRRLCGRDQYLLCL
uniref:Uncharacterized protein n=1 Tax=Oryza brachyantha TaxID=4533 RepID=J3LZR5_ORYBR